MWNPNYDTNELIYETETAIDMENRYVVAKEAGEGCSGNLGLEDANC